MKIQFISDKNSFIKNNQKPTFNKQNVTNAQVSFGKTKDKIKLKEKIQTEIDYAKNPQTRYEKLMEEVTHWNGPAFSYPMLLSSNYLGMGDTDEVLDLLAKLRVDKRVSDDFKSKVLLQRDNIGLIDRTRIAARSDKAQEYKLKTMQAILDASPNDETTRALLTTGKCIPLFWAESEAEVRLLLEASPDDETTTRQICTPCYYGKTPYTFVDEKFRKVMLEYCDDETRARLEKYPGYSVERDKGLEVLSELLEFVDEGEKRSENWLVASVKQKYNSRKIDLQLRAQKAQQTATKEQIAQRKRYFSQMLWADFNLEDEFLPEHKEEANKLGATKKALGWSQDSKILDTLKELKDDTILSDEDKLKLLMRDDNLALCARCFDDYSEFCGSDPEFNLKVVQAIFDVVSTKEASEKLLSTPHNRILPIEAASHRFNQASPWHFQDSVFGLIESFLRNKAPEDFSYGPLVFNYLEQMHKIRLMEGGIFLEY